MKIQSLPYWRPEYTNLKNHPAHVPDELLSEEWAQRNHGQSLHMLNERGGLGVTEALAIIHKDRNYYHELTQEKIDELNLLIANLT